MYEKNGIVYAGNIEQPIKVKSVRANNDYSLTLKFSNGDIKKFNADNLINQGIFTQLKNIDFFKSAYIDYGTVVWSEELDICPEYLYKNSN